MTCFYVCFLICSYADANQKAIAQAFFLPPLRDTPPQVLAIDVRNCVWVFKYKRFLTKCVHHATPKPRHNTEYPPHTQRCTSTTSSTFPITLLPVSPVIIRRYRVEPLEAIDWPEKSALSIGAQTLVTL